MSDHVATQDRFTAGLLFEVFEVLERHGYARPVEEAARNQATGRAFSALFQLVQDFEGRSS